MSAVPNAAQTADHSDESAAKAIWIVATLCAGGLVASLMQTLIIPIQPELPRLLNTSSSNASWVITATLLAAAVAMPVAGRLGDMFGKRRVILISALLLVVGSLICAIGSGLVPMVIGRAVQGLAMGFIPLGISLMREVTPPRLTSMSVAAMSATLGVGGAIGLPLAAWVAQQWNWHALFWMSAILAAIIAALVAIVVPRVDDAVGGNFDAVGAVLLGAGLVSVLIAVTKGNDWGWGEPTTLGLLIGGVAVLVLFGWYELRQDDPLVDLRTTSRPAVLLTNLAAIAVGFGMMAQAIVIPQLLELPESTGYGMGQSLLAAGLWMAPGGLMMLAFAPVSGGMINRFGAKPTLAVGATVVGLGYLAALLLMDAPWQLLIASIISSAGVGIGYAAMPTLILDATPLSEAGAAVGLNGLMRSVGTTASSAVMAMVLTSSTIDLGGHAVPAESTFHLCFLIGAIAAFVGAAITLFIPVAKKRTQAVVPTSTTGAVDGETMPVGG